VAITNSNAELLGAFLAQPLDVLLATTHHKNDQCGALKNVFFYNACKPLSDILT
jgi:hypothetical protein